MKELNYEEKELLKEILLNEIRNGNTINPKPFDTTPKQYKMLYSIVNKLELKKN